MRYLARVASAYVGSRDPIVLQGYLEEFIHIPFDDHIRIYEGNPLQDTTD